MANIIKPKALKDGSVIGIAAASSHFSKNEFEKGLDVLRSLGFKTKFSDKILRKNGYLAGTDKERADELNGLLADPEVDAIMFARGGYGIQRIMPLLDLGALQKNPKAIVGFSDLSALLSYIISKLSMTCFYGPVITQLADADEVILSSLREALTSTEPLRNTQYSILNTIKKGTASGPLIGGCLTLLSTSMGTGYQIDTNGAVIFIEDTGEKIYRYDRMLNHLKNAGLFEAAAGIIFGSMGLASDETSADLWSMVGDVLHDFDGPIAYGLKSGHTLPFLTLPLGVGCSLIADVDADLKFQESALS